MNSLASKIIFTAVAIISVHHVQAVDLSSSEEGPCIDLPTTEVDMDWMRSIKQWYYVLMSRYDLYATVAQLSSKDVKELSEDKIYYDSCIIWDTAADKDDAVAFNVSGFGGYFLSNAKRSVNRSGIMDLFSAEGELVGIYSTSLTDNKTFAVLPICFNSNLMSFAVISPYMTLPERTVNLIYDHAEAIGFKREQFTGLRYNSCPTGKW